MGKKKGLSIYFTPNTTTVNAKLLMKNVFKGDNTTTSQEKADVVVFTEFGGRIPEALYRPVTVNAVYNDYPTICHFMRIFNNARYHNQLMIGFGSGATFLAAMSGSDLYYTPSVYSSDQRPIVRWKTRNDTGPNEFQYEGYCGQLMNPYSLPRDEYTIVADSRHDRFKTPYLGNTKIILKQYISPEVIYFHNSNSLCCVPTWYKKETKANMKVQVLAYLINNNPEILKNYE